MSDQQQPEPEPWEKSRAWQDRFVQGGDGQWHEPAAPATED